MVDKVLITGANGQLGQSIAKYASSYKSFDFTFVTRNEQDLSEADSLDGFFMDKKFDVIVNCAAYTAVDKAESEPRLANQINHLAVKKIAEICKDKNMYLIHISTDYVFNGNTFRPYTEDDIADPESIYWKTKLDGEKALGTINPNGIIIRTGWICSEFGNDFLKTMWKLFKEKENISVVCNQIGAPAYASDLAKSILDIVSHSSFKGKKIVSNIYHYSNKGVAWYDFSVAICELGDFDCKVSPIETKDYPTQAKRPLYSVLNKKRLRKYSI